ncbi:MAG: ABC transporter ATP-binding protein, partial [Ignavibacteriales bacterium]|nr:ABC transporter ATP-binding protein [Ignavibacteriales bacterium]
MLRLENVSKQYGSFNAVNNLSLTVEAGDFFGFLGPNGAGKTTTIKMIAGLVTCTGGSITIDGYDIRKNPEEAKRIIGYIPDLPYLYERLTGKEFLLFSGGLYGLNYKQLHEEVDRVINLLQIGNWVNKRTEDYSQGMKQRISIASSLLHHPKFLLVDEPMVGLDPQSAKIVKDVFVQLAQTGTAIVMSTHSLHVAEEICQRIGVIKEGQLIFNDKLDSLKAFKDKEYKDLEYF